MLPGPAGLAARLSSICRAIKLSPASTFGSGRSVLRRTINLSQPNFGSLTIEDPGSSQMRDCIMSGTLMSGGAPGVRPENSGGVTPTTVNGLPLISILAPIAAGEALKRRCQYE